MLHIPDNLDRRQATAAKKFTAKFKKLNHMPNYEALERFGQKCLNDILNTDETAAIACLHMDIINDVNYSRLKSQVCNYPLVQTTENCLPTL